MKDAGRPGGIRSVEPIGGAGAGWPSIEGLRVAVRFKGDVCLGRPAVWLGSHQPGSARLGSRSVGSAHRLGAGRGRQLGQFLGGEVLEGASVALETLLEALGDLAELG